MRKSWAEYKRAARKRERDRRLTLERELNTRIFQQPFSSFVKDERRPSFGTHYLVLGRNWWDFSQDGGIEPFDDEELDEADKIAAFNSLGKAELVLSVLEDVVEALSHDIADYKRNEIESRISEIQRAGVNSNVSLDELERLKKMRNNLKKQVRRTLPQTRATG